MQTNLTHRVFRHFNEVFAGRAEWVVRLWILAGRIQERRSELLAAELEFLNVLTLLRMIPCFVCQGV